MQNCLITGGLSFTGQELPIALSQPCNQAIEIFLTDKPKGEHIHIHFYHSKVFEKTPSPVLLTDDLAESDYCRGGINLQRIERIKPDNFEAYQCNKIKNGITCL